MSSTAAPRSQPRLTVVGAGPAGLMAAERAARAGVAVAVFEAMPSPGRKLLMAGRGGLNLTHAEPYERFVTRYGPRTEVVRRWLDAFPPAAQREWVEGLGIETFVGSSGRVFPRAMKAAPLLRAWLRRLHDLGVTLHLRERWIGWDAAGRPLFRGPGGEHRPAGDALLVATGGASWKRLGADGAAAGLLAARGVPVAPWRPANCGFEVAWSEHFRARAAGEPLKTVALSLAGDDAPPRTGECVVTRHGLEGGVVYAFAAAIRDRLERDGSATLLLDLAPDRSRDALAAALATPRGRRSRSEHLRRRTGLAGVKAALLRECLPADPPDDAVRLADAIKRLPVTVHATRPLDEAISTAGGVMPEALDERLMLRALPGVFVAGELLDWEAPTGGYLLSACLASGRAAGDGAAAWLRERQAG